MRLPGFLIIGAMKAGTTSLYRDLLNNPHVFLPIDKEPENLLHDEVLTDAGRRDYARHFRGAGDDQVCGEASTGYTKLPDLPGAPGRARAVLGEDLKVIYLVRDPLKRIISHHHFVFSSGEVGGDINDAVADHDMFINWSRYAMQITPWIETFGPANVHIEVFEEYIADRVASIRSICRFLGVEPRTDLMQPQRVYNKSTGMPVAKGMMKRLIDSGPYRALIRPMLSADVKDRLRGFLLPKAPARPAPPSTDTVRDIVDGVRDDVAQLCGLMGREHLPWKLEEEVTAVETTNGAEASE